jgi:hypothetical protein
MGESTISVEGNLKVKLVRGAAASERPWCENLGGDRSGVSIGPAMADVFKMLDAIGPVS